MKKKLVILVSSIVAMFFLFGFGTKQADAVNVYRLYDTKKQEHLFTTDQNEINKLVSGGWRNEGIAFNAVGTLPVYRLYNPVTTRHLWTSSWNEINNLTIIHGWIIENNRKSVFNVYPKNSKYGSMVYRLNHHGINRHLWTINPGEKDYLRTVGWTYEGEVFRAYLPPK